ncbi:MAG: VCBS repeat-containing protein [Acidobacteria bacterium]|nr:VCBS repeat-containing protein [Acidobacteriota bacterium]
MKIITTLPGRTLFIFALCAALFAPAAAAQTHFDHDSKADLAVFRPAEGSWYLFSSESQTATTTEWGLASDKLAPADYDGDGLTDLAVWRPATGVWYILYSRDGKFDAIHWGAKLYIPNGYVADEPVPADYDGDGRADIAVWRPVSGVWYVLESSRDFDPKDADYFQWGKLGDIPVVADYDGDRRADRAVFRSTENRWYVYQSSNQAWKTDVFGQAGWDRLVAADYTGDERADFAVYRRGTWLIKDSATNEIYTFRFGTATDTAVPADYNGDGLTDLGVFRNGVWYVMETLTGNVSVFNFGTEGDVPATALNVKPSIVPVP